MKLRTRSRSNVIGSMSGFEDRPDGLYVRMQMANEVPSARVAYSLIRDSHLRGYQLAPVRRAGVLRFVLAKFLRRTA